MANNDPLQPENADNTEEVSSVAEKEQTQEQMIPKERLDQVISQRNEFKEELKARDERLEELQAKIEAMEQSKTSETTDVTAEEQQVIDRVAKVLKDKGFTTNDDLQNLTKAQQRSLQIKELSGKYGKGSGYPQFDAAEAMAHAKKNGLGDNLEAAYKDMYFNEILEVELNKRKEINVPESEKSTGQERELEVQATRSTIADMDTNEWEKNRDSVMESFKKSIFGR